VFRETRWSDKAGKELPGYTGVIYTGDAADKTLYDSGLKLEDVVGRSGNPLALATVVDVGVLAGAVQGVTGSGGRRGNPGGVAEAVANAVHRYNTLNEAARNAARDQHRYWTAEELGAVRSALDGLMAILADAGFRQSYSGRDGRPLLSSSKAYESRYGHVQLSEGGAHTAAYASFTPSGELKTLRRTSATRTGIRSRIDNPIDLATVIGVGVLAGAVQGVVEPYVTRHVYGRGAAPAGTADNPGSGMYLLQVFGKGYLAGGKAVTPARMHAPGLVARYTHDPRKALRVSLHTAEQMQRTHGGQFAAVPVEEALRAGPTSSGGGPAENPGGERFYAADDDWPLQAAGKWWAVYDSVTGEKMNVKGYGERPVYGSERLARKAADKLNRDWAAGRIKVIPERGTHAA
jgi:hypothetical protein